MRGECLLSGVGVPSECLRVVGKSLRCPAPTWQVHAVDALRCMQVLTTALVLLQHGRYTPLRLQAVLETALRESLEEIEIGSRRLVLSSFSVGAVSPQLLGARTYDIGPDALGFDFDIRCDLP